MKIIGITGGVGSGKSEILNILEEEYGAKIIIADQVAHRLMEPDGKSYEGIVQAFGKGIVKADGLSIAKCWDLLYFAVKGNFGS